MELTAIMPKSPQAAPVAQSERISLLDSLRGIAILGILLMNIPAFGLPGTSDDPSILNEQGINYYLWYFVDLIPEGTQRALFSMLFGAGIILFINSQQKKVDGLRPADYFFRRQLWLMVFSLFDVFVLLWFGDILFDYACLGMIMFAFRNLSARKLLIGAAVCFLFMLLRENRDLYQEKLTIYKGEKAAAMDTTVKKLNLLQKEDVEAMNAMKERSTQAAKKERMEKAILKTTGTYRDLYEDHSDKYVNSLVRYLYFGIWDVMVFMFIGMAFFKMGILTGNASAKVYWGMCIVGLGVGLLISYWRLQSMIDHHFNWFEHTKSSSFSTYELSRTFRAIGIFGFIMLLYKSGLFKWFFALMKPVGQMAFTNYLMQSLICGLIFYGIGFGMFGKLERYEIYLVLASIWLFQIILSHAWLKYFNFGPFEWLWRSLTYWKKQPWKRNPVS
jgi:uncharacterized protein